jgi:hypothetical protein
MTNLRDPRRYREEAAHVRKMAAISTDSSELRDSYLALAIEYERLAQVLEKAAPFPATTAPRRLPPN